MSILIPILGILIAIFFILFFIGICVFNKNTSRKKRIATAMLKAIEIISLIGLICLFSAVVFFLLLCISSL